ncbi:hypothetical protein DSECCO2_73120 [anaerobic digester metagenome]
MVSSPLELVRGCSWFYLAGRRRPGVTAAGSHTIEMERLVWNTEFRENGPHSLFQGRNLVLDDVPDDPPVDLEVSMDELVPGTGNQPPGDLRVLFFQGPRDVLGRLSDDLD